MLVYKHRDSKMYMFSEILMKLLPTRKLNLLLMILHIAALKYVNLILKMMLVLFLIMFLMMLIVAVKFLMIQILKILLLIVILLLVKVHMILILKILLVFVVIRITDDNLPSFSGVYNSIAEDNLDDNDNDLLVQFRRGRRTRGGKHGSRGGAR